MPRLVAALVVLGLVGWGVSLVAPLAVATRVGSTITGWGAAVPTTGARWLTRAGDLWVVAVLGLAWLAVVVHTLVPAGDARSGEDAGW